MQQDIIENTSHSRADEVPSGFDCFTYALKNYANFSGRARRREYWMFMLFSILITIGLTVVDSIIGTFDPETGYGVLSGLYALGVLVPSIAVGVRRLHDTGRSGWWFLINIIPFGAIVFLVFMCLDSKASGNTYGPPRKQLLAS